MPRILNFAFFGVADRRELPSRIQLKDAGGDDGTEEPV
jgi:hypothetical protein